MSATLNDDFPPLEVAAAMPNKPAKTALWKEAFVTDPAAVKPITGKQYKGNSPKPYWIIQRATEVFGACGIGWGLDVLSERFERLTDTDVLHVALIRVWYVFEGERGAVEQMGQTKACYKTKDGGMMIDEDAPKKSVTDGMVKCLSMLGFAGDIFSGRWDDSKYVAEAAAETKRRTDAANPLPHYMDEQINANSEAWIAAIRANETTAERIIAKVLSKYTMTDDQRARIEALDSQEEAAEWAESLAMEIRALMAKGDIEGAAKTLNSLGTGGSYDGEAKEAAWSRLESQPRSAIKAYDAITQAKTVDALNQAWKAAPKHSHEMLLPFATKRKEEILQADLTKAGYPELPEQAAA